MKKLLNIMFLVLLATITYNVDQATAMDRQPATTQQLRKCDTCNNIHTAAGFNHIECLKHFLILGTDVNALLCGITPLLCTINGYRNHNGLKCLQLLLSHPSIDPNFRHVYDRYSPLDLALEYEKWPVVKCLFECDKVDVTEEHATIIHRNCTDLEILSTLNALLQQRGL